jgi:hypothetical protein
MRHATTPLGEKKMLTLTMKRRARMNKLRKTMKNTKHIMMKMRTKGGLKRR